MAIWPGPHRASSPLWRVMWCTWPTAQAALHGCGAWAEERLGLGKRVTPFCIKRLKRQLIIIIIIIIIIIQSFQISLNKNITQISQPKQKAACDAVWGSATWRPWSLPLAARCPTPRCPATTRTAATPRTCPTSGPTWLGVQKRSGFWVVKRSIQTNPKQVGFQKRSVKLKLFGFVWIYFGFKT